jgi:hypothetical protein
LYILPIVKAFRFFNCLAALACGYLAACAPQARPLDVRTALKSLPEGYSEIDQPRFAEWAVTNGKVISQQEGIPTALAVPGDGLFPATDYFLLPGDRLGVFQHASNLETGSNARLHLLKKKGGTWIAHLPPLEFSDPGTSIQEAKLDPRSQQVRIIVKSPNGPTIYLARSGKWQRLP